MNLPDDLPAQAAMGLYDLFSELQSAVWEKYEHLLVPLCIAESGAPPVDHDDLDDGPPFF
jgi:hypothetical protein